MKITDWIIAIAAIANVIVYILLWHVTKKSIKIAQNTTKEMQKTTEFLIISEISKQWTPSHRAGKLIELFPEVAKKYF